MRCSSVQPLLSEYIDNALSGRATWEVDKHLAECNVCARLVNEMRWTVGALTAAPRFEVSTDFMAQLQRRIADLEPESPRRVWLANLREMFRPRALPVWGAAAAACALAVVLLLPRTPGQSGGPLVRPLKPEPSFVQAAKSQNVALAAANPLEDLATANLVASSPMESSAEAETVQ